MHLKVTASPIVQISVIEFPEGSTLEDLVKLSLKDFKKAIARADGFTTDVEKRYGIPFVEIYNPEYNDKMSGELTLLLNKTVGPSVPKPIVTPPVKPAPAPVAKALIKAKSFKTPAPKASGAKTKAEEVRDIIRENPLLNVEQMIPLVEKLGLDKNRAKIYLSGNLARVRT